MDRKGMADDELYDIDKVIGFHIAKYLHISSLSYDDLYQIAYIGYLKAQQNYNADFGPITLNYVSKYINGELTTELKKNYWETTSIITNDNLCQMKLKELSLEEQGESKHVLQEKVKKLLPKLPEREAYIIYQIHFSPRPKKLRELGRQLGVSHQRIGELKQKAVKRLRKMLDED